MDEKIFDELDSFEDTLTLINMAAASHDIDTTITEVSKGIQELQHIQERLQVERGGTGDACC
jgi:hypothetical protein